MYGLQLSKLFTYLSAFIIFWDQGGLNNRGSTVTTVCLYYQCILLVHACLNLTPTGNNVTVGYPTTVVLIY